MSLGSSECYEEHSQRIWHHGIIRHEHHGIIRHEHHGIIRHEHHGIIRHEHHVNQSTVLCVNTAALYLTFHQTAFLNRTIQNV